MTQLNDDVGTRTRVAVVGGGIAALALAYCLAQHTQVETTVYQMGWRLGGKLASSRSDEPSARIEEHGLHVWSGFYENAFRMMRDVYADDATDWPAVLGDGGAFSPWDRVAWFSQPDGPPEWIRNANDLPRNSAEPGTGGRLATPARLLARMLRFGVAFLGSYRGDRVTADAPEPPASLDQELSNCLRACADALDATTSGDEARVAWRATLDPLIERRDDLHRVLDGTDIEPRLFEVAVFVDLAITYVHGFVCDDVITRGFGAINDRDLRHWLSASGAHHKSIDSGFIRGAYSYLFATGDGDSPATLEAGTGMRMLLRLLMASSTSSFLRMNAGAGEVVIAPLYQYLRKRGVRFEFFHKLVGVQLSVAGGVASVTFKRQAEASQPPYEPLIHVTSPRTGRAVAGWPAQPKYCLLTDAGAIEGLDLESDWTDDAQFVDVSLIRHEDFDHLVLAVPPSVLKQLLPDETLPTGSPLIAGLAVPTAATQSLQLWCVDRPNTAFEKNATSLATAYQEPWDTFADMSHLLPMESWPANGPQSLLYLCGVIPAAASEGSPDAVRARVLDDATTWLDRWGPRVVPGATRPGGVGFDWSQLYNPQARPDPLGAQFLSVNIDRSARYTLAPPRTAAKRVKPGGTGIDGLTVVGDWVSTGLDYGCIEAAVMSGFAGARAITGSPAVIYGEDDFLSFEASRSEVGDGGR